MQIEYCVSREDYVNMILAICEHKPGQRRRERLSFLMLCLFALLFGLTETLDCGLAGMLWSLPIIAFFAFFLFGLKDTWINLHVRHYASRNAYISGQFKLELRPDEFQTSTATQDARHKYEDIEYILETEDYCCILFDSTKFTGIPIGKQSVSAGDLEAFTETIKKRWLETPLAKGKIQRFEK